MRRRRARPDLGKLEPWVAQAQRNLGMSRDQAHGTLPFYRRALAAEIVEIIIRERVDLPDEAREALGALEAE